MRASKAVYGEGLVIACGTGDELAVELASYYGVRCECCSGLGLGYGVDDLDLIAKKCDIVCCIEPYDGPLRDARCVLSLASLLVSGRIR